ncbi:type II toxin-antitoxin system VapC family toxin [Arthrobacter sp. I2-34]|uniref:Ribonuclease VapC n=1 Tax=Arthrobacter hankyongi TaxID=2904801 RepID=A0ABS9L2H6_9MICC|nr:type II toxin-antitoxin system VapC family toxin [Arthrobacter hankyongi]MCG2620880.1 type II toxin-antitoxin system VapC family toxin [Arthrobacter hankyongi]
MIIYLDTSAVLKLVIDEAESGALARQMTKFSAAGDMLVASMLLYTELHCAARRRATPLPAHLINSVLNSVNLVDVSREDLLFAAALTSGLRTADAIHLATAIRLHADVLVAYDRELLAAAESAGLSTASPGRSQES